MGSWVRALLASERELPRALFAIAAAGSITLIFLVASSQSRAPAGAATAPVNPSGVDVAAGRELWSRDCAVCHGTRGEGSFQAPPITGSGTASVDFMVRTGRMPPAGPNQTSDIFGGSGQEALRGPVRYTDQQIRDLVAATAELTNGPTVPDTPELAAADLTRGGDLYRLQCASCHQMAGQGGALAYGTIGPPLGQATPTEVLEAMRTGPGSMPLFPPTVVDHDGARDVAAYVQYLQAPEDRGGVALDHIGPVAEGAVAWIVGLGAVVAFCLWLGQRSRPPR